jgi:proton-coupled amino acid transporter
VTALYVAMGFYGYLKYGTDIKSSITLNLPAEDM